MSNLQRYENLKQVVVQIQPQFDDLAKIHGAVNYKREASFALQLLSDSDYLAQVAMGNQDSLKKAVLNVAAIGLSLSPVLKLAYLVPRKHAICLDISYLGYIQLAIEAGSIKWAAAEIVRKEDRYEFLGVNREPIHKFDPFSNRGIIVGAYCLAKTHDDEFILTQMSLDDIYKIRDRSESWKAYLKDKGKQGPWVTDEAEMIKKTLIRRAQKSWPKGDTRGRLDKAIDVINEADPVELASATVASTGTEREKQIEAIRNMLIILDRTEEKYLSHLTRSCKRDIKKLDDLTDIEMEHAVVMLTQFIDAKAAKGAANETAI